MLYKGYDVNKNTDIKQLDKELLNGYLQSLGIEVVKKMLALYEQQSTLYIADIEAALLSESLQLWQEHCHKMKGAAGSVGLKSLHARMVVMEKSTESSTIKAQQLAELHIHNKQAIIDFNDWIESC